MLDRPMDRRALLSVIGPGLLVAATGVGAGDIYTAGFAGNRLGTAVLWAVLAGALLKLVVTEGLARFQLVTGKTLLEGSVARLGRPFCILFGLYLLTWSYFVGAALMSACGVTLHAMVPLFQDPGSGKIFFGLVASALGTMLVLAGGFRLFEKVMTACIGVMFATVVYTAIIVKPDWKAAAVGLVVPRIPMFGDDSLLWTVALVGGVGGTLTVLCYGYWLREIGREGEESVRVTRLDLAAGYTMTMIFGMAMVLIGSRIPAEGKGASFIVNVAVALEGSLGPFGRWLFLVGTFAAVFSSLLGVWQSVPYVFADFVGLSRGEDGERLKARLSDRSRTYRGYLLALAIIPALSLRFPFREVQKYYAAFGAMFMPFLAVILLVLNGHALGERHRNGPLTKLVLVATVVAFGIFGWIQVRNRF